MRIRAFILTAVALIAITPGPVQAAAPPLPSSIASTGDSITRGFDATWNGCILKDCAQYSWSTGIDLAVFSQYQRILAANSAIAGQDYNFARTGATMADLDGQLKSAAAVGAQYVTVLMGANDLCTSTIATMTPPSRFKAELDQALIDFYSADRGAHLYLSSLPNLFQLWSLEHTNTSATRVWALARICQSMLGAANTDAQRQQVVSMEQAYNSILATECARAVTAGVDCHWDGLAGYNFQFTTSDISPIDFFHPSIAGQNSVAALTWAAGYWPGV